LVQVQVPLLVPLPLPQVWLVPPVQALLVEMWYRIDSLLTVLVLLGELLLQIHLQPVYRRVLVLLGELLLQIHLQPVYRRVPQEPFELRIVCPSKEIVFRLLL
jgi:hypothetical protein